MNIFKTIQSSQKLNSQKKTQPYFLGYIQP